MTGKRGNQFGQEASHKGLGMRKIGKKKIEWNTQ
jgi:hypothetical protein